MHPRLAPHLIAVAVTVPFATWIAVSDIRGVLPPAAWLLPLAAAYYLGLRIGRELIRGVRRARGEAADGPQSPEDEPGDAASPESGGRDDDNDVRTISLKRDRDREEP